MSAFDPIRELSENANAYTPLGPGDERIVTDRYVLWLGRGDEPAWNVAQRFRLDAGEVDEVRAEIHAAAPRPWAHRLHLGDRLVRDAGRPGRPAARARPGRRRRAARGRDGADRAAGGLGAAAGLDVRRAASDRGRADRRQDRRGRLRLAVRALRGGSIRSGDGDLPRVPRRRAGRPGDGRVLASGASRSSAARRCRTRAGVGRYRALVAARWRGRGRARARRRSFTQAGRQSRPILARLGFREVCEIRILLDAFDRSRP